MNMGVKWFRGALAGLALVISANFGAVGQTGGGGSAPASVPVFQNLTLPLASPAPVAPFQLPFADPQARGKVGSLTAGTPITTTDYTTCSANADQPTQEIFDLAAALKNDPQTIFNYVYENIDLEPSIESSKGALGTYLDQSGSSFDQSSLLVALLRSASANITASGQVSPIGSVQYVIGTTTLTAAQMGLAALPAQLGMNAGASSATIPYAWVQAVINGTTVTYNPAGKTYTLLPGNSLSPWFGSQPPAVSSSVWSYLTATSQSIFNQAGQNYAAVTAFIGGRRLNTTAPPLTGMVSNGSPPSDTIPAIYRTTLLFETTTTHASFCTDQVYGHMVVAAGSTATSTGTVWIDQVPFYTYTQGTGQMYVGQNQELWINHAGSLPAQSANVTLPWLGWNVFNLGIGRVGRFRAQHDASLAARNTAYGGWPTGNSILSLLASSSGQLSQTSHATELMDQLAGTYTQNHNMLQIVSNNETINTPLIATSVTGITATPASGLQVSPNSVAYALSALQSAQEAVALQGVGVPGATSAATLLSAVSSPSGLQVLSHNSSPPPLPAYNAAQNSIFGDYLYLGYDICLPVTAPLWGSTGQPAAPFLALAPNGTSAFVLVTPDGNLYKGAATPATIDPNSFVSIPAAAAGQASSGGAGSGLAVNPSSGEVTFGAPLLSIGSKGSPYSLEFDLAYSSATAAQRGQSSSGGIGWSHNLDISLAPSSDGFAILGSDLTGPAIPGIVAMYELLLNSNNVVAAYAANVKPSTSTLLITAATAGWFVQQTNQDVVTVNNGGAQEVFAHMPDGSYRPAEPSPALLTLPAGTGGTYTLSTGRGTTMVFSNAGPIQSMTDSGNHTTSFSYTTTYPGFSQLHTVATAYHTLTFQYQAPAVNQAPKLSLVSDETNRSVSLNYTNNSGYYPSDQILASATLVDNTQAQPRALSFAYKTVPLNYTGTSNLYVGGASSNLLELTGAYDPMSNESTILYDSRIMPTIFTDALSNPTRYFAAGNRSEVDDAFGNATHTHTYPMQPLGADLVFTDSYDALNKITNTRHNYAGQLVSEQAPDWSYPKLYGYDGSGNLQSTSWASTSGGPTTTSATYNSCNLPLTTIDWLTRKTTYTYESLTGNGACLVAKIVHPTVDGTANTPAPTEQFTYTDGNRPATVTAADNEVTHYGYGENGNAYLDLTSVTQDWNRLNLKTILAYDNVGNVQSVTDPRTYATTFGYDTARRVNLKTTPPIAALGGATFNTVYKYDLDGRLKETDQDSGTAGQPLVAKTVYDAVGNLKTQTQPTTSTAAAHTTAYTYDADNRLSTITDPAGQLVTHTYDPNSRLYQVLDGYNQVSQTYHYTNDGLTHSITDGNGHAITYGYDYRDRLTTTTYADGTYEQLTLDNGGRVYPNRRTRNNVLIGYTYDNLDRVSTETDPGATAPISFTYDLVNRPLTVGDQNGTFTYMYDTAGRQKQTTRPDLKVTGYMSDADGNTATITYPDGYLYTYGHDELDRMTTVQETVPQTATPITLATYGYNALSERASLTYGNGTSSAYTYDPFEGLHTVTHNIIGMTPVTFTYDRDANERRMTDTVSSPTFLWHPPVSGSTSYTPNTLNQYGAINGMTLGYDPNGNLQTDPTAPLGTTTYGWDLKSRMTSIANSQHTATYSYDPFSRRGSKLLDGVAYVDVFDGQNKIAQYTGSGVETEHFVYGLGNAPLVRETVTGTAVTARTYLHLDGLGSVVALSNTSGALQSSNAFSPWGEGPSTVVTSFGFAGMSFDQETGLYFDNARYYSPQQGRFISPDPIGVKGGVDLYAYAGNDPVNNVDPTGLDTVDSFLGSLSTDIGSFFNNIFSGIGNLFSGGGLGETVQTTFVNGQSVGSYVIPDNHSITPYTEGPSPSDNIHNGMVVFSGTAPAGTSFSFAPDGALLGQISGPEDEHNVTLIGINPHYNAITGYQPPIQQAPDLMAGALLGMVAIDSYAIGGPEEGAYLSFRALKAGLGSAGKDMVYHHIVEQAQIKASGFAPTIVNNVNNVVAIDGSINHAIGSYYSKGQVALGGLSPRAWLSGQSFEAQFNYGVDVLGQYLK